MSGTFGRIHDADLFTEKVARLGISQRQLDYQFAGPSDLKLKLWRKDCDRLLGYDVDRSLTIYMEVRSRHLQMERDIACRNIFQNGQDAKPELSRHLTDKYLASVDTDNQELLVIFNPYIVADDCRSDDKTLRHAHTFPLCWRCRCY